MREMADAGWEYASFSFSAFLLIAISRCFLVVSKSSRSAYAKMSIVSVQGSMMQDFQMRDDDKYEKRASGL